MHFGATSGSVFMLHWWTQTLYSEVLMAKFLYEYQTITRFWYWWNILIIDNCCNKNQGSKFSIWSYFHEPFLKRNMRRLKCNMQFSLTKYGYMFLRPSMTNIKLLLKNMALSCRFKIISRAIIHLKAEEA